MVLGPRTSGHPQPFRTGEGLDDVRADLTRFRKETKRDLWEGESWDDNSGLVFTDYEQPAAVLPPNASRSFAITVPATYPGTRFEIDAEARAKTSAVTSINVILEILVNGTLLPDRAQEGDSSAGNHLVSLRHFGVTDARIPGLYTVTARISNVTSGAGSIQVDYIAVKCRRGRPAGL